MFIIASSEHFVDQSNTHQDIGSALFPEIMKVGKIAQHLIKGKSAPNDETQHVS